MTKEKNVLHPVKISNGMTKTKRVFAAILTVTTILWSMGPSLVYALAVTNVIVSTSSIEIEFDDDVLATEVTAADELGAATKSADDTRNYSLSTGDPLASRMLSQNPPFDMSTEYFANEHKMRIYGLETLHLNVGDDWQFQIPVNTIQHTTSTTTYVDAYTGTGTVVGIGQGGLQDPYIDYIANYSEGPSPTGCHTYPCGAVGSTIQINGSNYTTSTKANFHFVDTGTLVDATFVSDTQMTVVIPAGVGPGNVIVQMQDPNTGRFSNDREIVVWDSTIGVVIGYLELIDSTGVDGANIRADLPNYWGSGGEGFTHSNGTYAVPVTSAGTYEVFFTTPPGITEAAPPKQTGIAVTLGAIASVGAQTTKIPTLLGKVCAPDSDPCAGVENVEVRVHTYDWTIEQMTVTRPDGSWGVYIDNTGDYVNVGVEAEPSGYHKDVLGYKPSASGLYDQTLWTGDTIVGLEIDLTLKNVTGTLKTPAGATSNTNPYPDTPVPNASIQLRTQDWSYEQWTNTDANGNFEFGGALAGTNYVLEIEPPWSGNFEGYARTTITGLVLGAAALGWDAGTSITDLNQDAKAVTSAIRFGSPNVFGRVLAGGSPVDDAWVNMWGPNAWYGTNTDSTGKFKFGGVEIGWYEIEVDPGSNASAYSRYMSVVEITSATSNDLGDISLSAPNVSGYVYGPTGTSAQSAWVDACPYNAPGQCYGDNSDPASGVFGISLPNGTWELQIHPDWGSIYAQPLPKILVVSGDVLTTVDGSSHTGDLIIRMADPSVGGLMGMVCAPGDTDSCEHPQSDIGLNLRPQNAMHGFNWSQTDNSGNFAFANVDAGTYDLEAEPWGASAYSRKLFTITINSDDSVTVGSNTYANRNIRLFLSSPNVSGYLYTPEFAAAHTSTSNPTPDQPVPWSWVNLHQEGPMMGPGGWYGGGTDDTGYFKFGGVTPGSNYVLEVDAGWGSAYTQKRYSGITFTDSDADGVADECNVGATDDGDPADSSCDLSELLGTGATKRVRVGIPNMRGQIVKPDGITGVRDAWVMVHDQYWMNQAGGNTDMNGYFNLGGLSNGTYQIEINMPWGGDQAYTQPSGLTVVIANDMAEVRQNNVALAGNKITLTTPAKVLTGYVYKDTNGDGDFDLGTDTVVTNARVEAHRDMGGGFYETRVNSDGEYTLKLAGGAWWVEVWPDWDYTQPDWVYNQPPNRIAFPDTTTSECKGTTVRCTAADANAAVIGAGLDFKVQSANSTITGVVKNPTGQAVANVWVDAFQGMGMGNGSNTDNNGRFNISVPAGTYEIMVMPNTPDYGSPDPIKAKVTDGATTDVGELFLKARNAHIKGTVTDTAGNNIGNVMVEAWQFDSPGWVMGFTDTNTGQYDLIVGSGTWGIMVMPMSGGYVYQGAPLNLTVDANETSTGNDFVLKIADTTLKVSVVDSAGDRITDFWGGVWIKDTSVNDMLDFGHAMDDMMEKGGLMEDGMMVAGDAGGGPVGPGMEQGKFEGGGLVNGYTEIKVPGGSEDSPAEYEVGLHSPPGAQYTLDTTKTVQVVSGTDQEINLVVKENDATITGYLYVDANSDGDYDAGEEVTGIRAFIDADRAEGGWQSTESESDGSYTLNLAAGTWRLDAWIDVFMTFGASKYMVINEDRITQVGSGGVETRDFELKSLDATISGTVTDPDGDAMDNVWVFVDYATAEMVDDFKGPGGPGVGYFTDINGDYTLNVAGGTYNVGAGIPPWDTRDLLNPDLIEVTVAAGAASADNDIQFHSSDATIVGTITYDSINQPAFVRAWSDEGGGTGTLSLDGNYTLKVTSEDTWHVSAATEINDMFYESPEQTITTSAGANTKDLVLEASNWTVPESKTTSFSADNSKSVILDDGLTVEAPAGSIKSSGTVTVTVTPKTDAKPDSKDKPIGISYDFVAKDADGKEITTFTGDIQITIPYNEDEIIDAGYSETDLTPKYYNETTGTWEPWKSVVQDTANNTFTITTDHFTPGGLTGGRLATAAAAATTTTTTTPGGGAGAAVTPTAAVGPTNTSVWINWGAETTVSRTVTLSLGADNATEMLISNSADFSGATWQTYKTSKYWTLSSGDGEKVVYVKYRDEDYDESSIMSDTIVLAEVAPVAAAEKDLVKTADSGAVYLILNGKRHVFPHLAVYQSWAYPDDFSSVNTISSADLTSFSEGDPVPFRDGSMFRGTSESLYGLAAAAVFYVEDGKLRAIQSGEIYQALFNDPDWNLVTWVPDDLLTKFAYPLGDIVASSDIHPNGSLIKYVDSAAVYLIENGKKRPFNSWNALTSNGYGSRKIFEIPAAETYEDATVIGALAETLTVPVIAAAFRSR